MSTQRGNAQRTRAQKYKNRTVFRNDLHDKTPQQLRLNALHVSTVCQHCKEVIEWKIKYKKYKPLTQAKTCTRCQQRNVRKAYHVICRDCAAKDRVCAKCLKCGDEVAIEAPGPTPQEQQQLQIEMERLIKSFSERRRRAFLRYMNKGKQGEAAHERDNENDDEEEHCPNEKPACVPHSRDELLNKIKQLKLSEANVDNDDEDDFDFSGDDGDLTSDDDQQVE